MPELVFKGKVHVANHHLVVPFHELVAVKSKGLAKTPSLHDNLLLHGDNLLALKALLPTHAGKVKCVYIDPPYNTGKEGWAYNDKVNSPLMKDWLAKTIDREDATRHDKWCCMMLPRLKLLRELMSEDAAIFVSIDDNEVHHLRCLMDEVFGEENFLGTIIWNNATDNNPTNVATEHEYAVCYANRREMLEAEWKVSTLAAKQKLLEVEASLLAKGKDPADRDREFKAWLKENKPYIWPFQDYKFIDARGIYTGIRGVHNPGKEGYRYDVIHPKTKKACKQPLMGYRFPEDRMNELIAEDRIIFGDDHKKVIELKAYVVDYKAKLSSVFALDGRAGPNEIKELFPDCPKAFKNPKSAGFIEHLIGFASHKDSTILDSFAGSGTSAHAVFRLNSADGGSRRWIGIQIQEELKEDHPARKLDFKEVIDITAERLRRCIKGVATAKDEKLRAGYGGSFSYFKLGEAVALQTILESKDLPTYETLAAYVFFTATGEEFDPSAIDRKTGLIGRSKGYDVYLLYTPEIEALKELALDLPTVRKLPPVKGGKDRKRLVYAPTRFMDDALLHQNGIVFAQLPYEIYERVEKAAK